MEQEGEVLSLIGACDRALVAFGLETYYKDPSLHASFGWALGKLEEAMETGVEDEGEGKSMCPREVAFSVGGVACKIGNRFFRFDLPSLLPKL